MPTYLVANSQEDFDKAIEGGQYEGAVRLEDPAVLAGQTDVNIVVLPGAEEHPILQNGRVQQLRGQITDSGAGSSQLGTAADGSGYETKGEHATAKPVDASDTDGDRKEPGDAVGEGEG